MGTTFCSSENRLWQILGDTPSLQLHQPPTFCWENIGYKRGMLWAPREVLERGVTTHHHVKEKRRCIHLETSWEICLLDLLFPNENPLLVRFHWLSPLPRQDLLWEFLGLLLQNIVKRASWVPKRQGFIQDIGSFTKGEFKLCEWKKQNKTKQRFTGKPFPWIARTLSWGTSDLGDL